MKPLMVHDLSAMQVFEGATNRTAVFVCEKTIRPFKYPVKYTTWTGASRIAQDESLVSVRTETTQRKMGAIPVVPSKDSSPWLTASNKALSGLQKVIGVSNYKAYEGVNTGGLNGCFWIRVIEKRPNGELLIENLHDVGKIKVNHVQAVIESDLVYPLLRGRDVLRWYTEPSAHIILAQDSQTRKGIPESEMKLRWPKTFAYLKRFEGDSKDPKRGTLRGRATKAVRGPIEKGSPFYSMFGVGPYSLASFRVVWGGQVATALNVSVSGSDGRKRPILNDQTAYLVPFDNESEAHYLAALLNSAPVRFFYGCLAYKHTSMNFIQGLEIEKYKPHKESEHDTLSSLSQQCHTAKRKNRQDKVATLEAEINAVAARIWEITDAELKAIQKALSEL